MKLAQTLSALVAFGFTALLAQAQPAPKIVVVNMEKIFDGHYETLAQNDKLKADTQKAQDEIDQMNKEGNALVEQYKELDEQSKNPTATADAKAKALSDAQKLAQQIQAKSAEINNLANTAKQTFQQRIQTFRTMMMEDISKVAVQVGKDHGATIIIDSSGPTLIGIAPVIYADPAYDITDAVMAEINKNKPASAAMPSSSSSMTSPGTSSGDIPKISVPGVSH